MNNLEFNTSEKVTKRKPETSGHDEKCKSLEKKLAASKDKVQCLRKELRKTTAVIEAIEKKTKVDLEKEYADMKVELEDANTKANNLAIENKVLKQRNHQLKQMLCPNAKKHLTTATTLESLAEECSVGVLK